MHTALRHVDHRPWPLPARRWTWRQTWCDLLFAHWPVPAARLRQLVPPSLEIDEFDGTSWIGVVPFRMRGVMRRPLPDLPWISAFPELNLRLYVTRDGKPGVWFLSLDAGNPLAVWAARRFFHLPYFHARMSLRETIAGIEYRSERRARRPRVGERNSSARDIGFEARYRPTSDVHASRAGSLEHWVTERYCLYARSPSGLLTRTEVQHAAWPLQRAEVAIARNELFEPHGLAVPGPPALLHFARRLDVIVWSPESVPAASPPGLADALASPRAGSTEAHARSVESPG